MRLYQNLQLKKKCYMETSVQLRLLCRERCSESDLPWRSMAFESGVFPRRDISLVLDPLSLVILCNSCVRLTTRGICKAWIINPTND